MKVRKKGRFSSLSYKNGKEILPEKLLKELQKYVQGELIYIPRSDKERVPWGKMNGTRDMIDERNRSICCLYREGVGIRTLMEEFNLSEDSIRKIIWKNTKHEVKKELVI